MELEQRVQVLEQLVESLQARISLVEVHHAKEPDSKLSWGLGLPPNRGASNPESWQVLNKSLANFSLGGK